MDKPIDISVRKRKKRQQYLRGLGLLILLLLAVWLFRTLLRPKAAANELRMAMVERGDIQQSVTATGLVVASFEEQLNAPVATTIKQLHLNIGSEVKPQDLILSLDREYVQLDLESRNDQLALKRNNVALLKLEYDRDLQELDYNTQIKEMELSTAAAQLSDARRLLAIGGATAEEVERAELQLRITELERDKLRNELAFRRASLAARKQNLELEVGMQEKEVAQLSRKLRETEVRAPRAGVITWINEKIGQQVAEGSPLVRIADLGHYRMEASCSDRYADQIKLGLPVVIKLAKGKLQGQVAAILPEVENNTLKFIVHFEQPDHPALRPSLLAETEIIIDEKTDVLRIKNGPAFRGGIRQEVYVVRDQEAIATEVRLGMRSGDFIEIEGADIQAGDRIIISDTKDFLERKRIKLN